jgi:hypothetical protein
VALYPAPGPAGELAGGGRRPAGGRGDVLERQAEHVVQHERHALGGIQRVEHDQQRQPDRVGQHRFLLWPGIHGGCRVVRDEGPLVAGLPGSQHVQAYPGDDRGEPAVEVGHAVRATARGVDPGLLHGVLGLVQRAENPVGNRAQPGPALLEAGGQPVVHVTSPFRVPSYPLTNRMARV